jgi:AraC-like DNA-binding protein
MTYSNFLTKTRIDNAVKLIQNGETEVQNIAFQVGYNDSSYFIKVFKDKVGITPYSYIKMIEENK